MRSVLAALAAVLFLSIPPVAHAAGPFGSEKDPAGDSFGFANMDILHADAQYDPKAGELIVAAGMKGNIADGPSTFLSYLVGSRVAGNTCAGNTVALGGYSDDPYDLVKVSGVSDTGSEPIAVTGQTVVFAAAGRALVDKGYRCMTLVVEQKGSDMVMDTLAKPLDFGPKPACSAPKVKGLSLTAAKRAIARNHCRLGTVKRPRHVRKGARLVVTRSAKHGSAIALVLGPKPRHR